MSQPIRVVVVDDSAMMRRVITSLLEQDPAIRVVGTASNGREAIVQVERLRPDVVTMDVRMPIMDGLATTEHLMAFCPTPILVLTATVVDQEVDITFKMLGAGALEVFEKPAGNDPQALRQASHALIRRIKVLSRVKVVRHLRGRRRLADGPGESEQLSPQKASTPEPRALTARAGASARELVLARVATAADPEHFPVIVIGASTGGPRIVYQILSALPAGLGAAVVVVQHIANGFSQGMAEWLATSSALPVHLREVGDRLEAGRVLVVPDQNDLLIASDGRAHLSANPLLIQRPSIDVAMQSAAEVYGPRAIGVLLTGMGRDGAYGLLTIRRLGGHTIAQDEASCTIFGMPRAAIQLDAAMEVLAPNRIIARLIELVAAQNRRKE